MFHNNNIKTSSNLLLNIFIMFQFIKIIFFFALSILNKQKKKKIQQRMFLRIRQQNRKSIKSPLNHKSQNRNSIYTNRYLFLFIIEKYETNILCLSFLVSLLLLLKTIFLKVFFFLLVFLCGLVLD